MFNIEKYDSLIPIVYLIVTAVIAVVGHKMGLPEGVTGMLVGAGLMRVKIPAKSKG